MKNDDSYPKASKTISARLDLETIGRLDSYAAKKGLTRTDALTLAIDCLSDKGDTQDKFESILSALKGMREDLDLIKTACRI